MYVSNKDLVEELRPWLETVKKIKKKHPGYDQTQLPELPETVGTGIIQIVTGLGSRSNFANYSYLDDMIGDAVMNCIAYIHNFDLNKSNNVFAYIYQIAHNAFIRRITLEQKHVYTKDKMMADPLTQTFLCNREIEKNMRPPSSRTPDAVNYRLDRDASINHFEANLTKRKEQQKQLRAKKVVASK